VDPDTLEDPDDGEFVELYARALWYEEREVNILAAGISKVFASGGDES
jgi:hypothetical protein